MLKSLIFLLMGNRVTTSSSHNTHHDAKNEGRELNMSRLKLCEVPISKYRDYTNAIQFNLSQNIIHTFPSQITVLKHLTDLNLSHNRLKSVSESITELTELRILNLSFNCFVQVPDCIGNISSLVELDLSNNYLQEIPRHLRILNNLEVLNLEKNALVQFTDDVFADGFVKLKNLNIMSPVLLDLPTSLSSLKQLNHLTVLGKSLEPGTTKLSNVHTITIMQYSSINNYTEYLEELFPIIILTSKRAIDEILPQETKQFLQFKLFSELSKPTVDLSNCHIVAEELNILIGETCSFMFKNLNGEFFLHSFVVRNKTYEPKYEPGTVTEVEFGNTFMTFIIDSQSNVWITRRTLSKVIMAASKKEMKIYSFGDIVVPTHRIPFINENQEPIYESFQTDLQVKGVGIFSGGALLLDDNDTLYCQTSENKFIIEGIPKIKNICEIYEQFILLDYNGRLWISDRTTYINFKLFEDNDIPPIQEMISKKGSLLLVDENQQVWEKDLRSFTFSLLKNINNIKYAYPMFYRESRFKVFIDNNGDIWANGTNQQLFDTTEEIVQPIFLECNTSNFLRNSIKSARN